jgi:cytidyltransferase-like protein
MDNVVVSGGFDNLGSQDMRFLEESSKLGRLTVLLWPDELLVQRNGSSPKFPFAERRYFLQAIRFVSDVIAAPSADELPPGIAAGTWADRENAANGARAAYCREHAIAHRVFTADDLRGFPEGETRPSGRKRVIVTGCYDWFHSGHVRFFEEASVLGDLYVGVGNDANIRLLKGEGHPLIPEQERRYMVGAIKYVTCAMVSTGSGWLDADPDIRKLKPDYYVVNEDGDKGGKREYCAGLGIEYVVLRREPAPGLPKRSSTDLRGF